MDSAKEFVDYYKMLGIEPGATPQQIKKAYRALALQFHPDKRTGKAAAQRFSEVQTAYEVLKVPDKKKAYDNVLMAKLEAIKRYEAQGKERRKMVDDLLEREKAHVASKISERQKEYRDKYEDLKERNKLLEEMRLASRDRKEHSSKNLDSKIKSSSILVSYHSDTKTW